MMFWIYFPFAIFSDALSPPPLLVPCLRLYPAYILSPYPTVFCGSSFMILACIVIPFSETPQYLPFSIQFIV